MNYPAAIDVVNWVRASIHENAVFQVKYGGKISGKPYRVTEILLSKERTGMFNMALTTQELMTEDLIQRLKFVFWCQGLEFEQLVSWNSRKLEIKTQR